MSYTQLTLYERQQLHHLRTTTDLSLRAIAVKLGRNPSSLSRELDRNCSGEAVYLPDAAQAQMQARRQQSQSRFSGVTETCIAELKERLQQYHSPEQISGRLRREGQVAISHERIYQMIYANHSRLAGVSEIPATRPTQTTQARWGNLKAGADSRSRGD